MSALPRQDVTIGEKFDLSGSGRLWTHTGEWTYQTWVRLEHCGQNLYLHSWIRPEESGYKIIFGDWMGAQRASDQLYTSAEEAAQWFELLLEVELSIKHSEERVWPAEKDERQLDMFEEVHCG